VKKRNGVEKMIAAARVSRGKETETDLSPVNTGGALSGEKTPSTTKIRKKAIEKTNSKLKRSS